LEAAGGLAAANALLVTAIVRQGLLLTCPGYDLVVKVDKLGSGDVKPKGLRMGGSRSPAVGRVGSRASDASGDCEEGGVGEGVVGDKREEAAAVGAGGEVRLEGGEAGHGFEGNAFKEVHVFRFMLFKTFRGEPPILPPELLRGNPQQKHSTPAEGGTPKSAEEAEGGGKTAAMRGAGAARAAAAEEGRRGARRDRAKGQGRGSAGVGVGVEGVGCEGSGQELLLEVGGSDAEDLGAEKEEKAAAVAGGRGGARDGLNREAAPAAGGGQGGVGGRKRAVKSKGKRQGRSLPAAAAEEMAGRGATPAAAPAATSPATPPTTPTSSSTSSSSSSSSAAAPAHAALEAAASVIAVGREAMKGAEMAGSVGAAAAAMAAAAAADAGGDDEAPALLPKDQGLQRLEGPR
jgi:hypothetical protein